MHATLDKQIIITVENQVGALAEITEIISSAGINLVAACAYAVGNKGVIMFVSEDSKQAMRLLKDKNYDVREEEVVLLSLDNKPGALRALTARIAEEQIDLTLAYGSVEKHGKTSRIVLISEDNLEVLAAIKTLQ